MDPDSIGFFDQKLEWSVVERVLPHWSQPGTLTFVTWRAADALPTQAIARLDREIAQLLQDEGLNPKEDWRRTLAMCDRRKRGRVQWKLFRSRDKFLDRGYGGCLLARPELSEIVETSMRKFDGQRYLLTDLVIMPNHLHFIAAFKSESALLEQCAAWKRFTARAINERTGRRGRFWQADQFDHLIRGPEQFEHYRKYIASNPETAGLTEGRFRYYRRNLQASGP